MVFPSYNTTLLPHMLSHYSLLPTVALYAPIHIYYAMYVVYCRCIYYGCNWTDALSFNINWTHTPENKRLIGQSFVISTITQKYLHNSFVSICSFSIWLYSYNVLVHIETVLGPGVHQHIFREGTT